ncbi:TIR domain-containing protein [Cupriavidus sp. KB_39]|uniref:TIR domain-containing protein n=1 Tax=Cupriavidus sp. KB_39 TaxID=3233036 RepID=UPI003F90101A
MEIIKVFISYSWDSPEHRAWVKKFADSLEEIEEITVTWDGYDLDSLVDKNFFMEAGIHDADYVVVITTAKYKAKADERNNGVGLETFLASALHWNGLLRDKRSNVIQVLREAESTPRYLEGHFHLDFSSDAQFPKRFEELLSLLQGRATAERPKKRTTLAAFTEGAYDFTRVEELIQVNHPNRRAIVNGAQGTDFSGANRVKYEIWETKSPALGYFLALHSSGTIRHSAQHAARALLSANLRPSDITVLRPRVPRPEQELIARSFAEAGLTTRVHECTYKEYIWDYCIDASLKIIDPPSPIENYTNQALTYTNAGELVRADSAVDYIVDVLQKPSKVAAHLVVAPGGMGKTSLCLSVAEKLHFREDLRSSVILIQAESIKKYVAERGLAQSRIESIYDIYELYAKLQGHGKLFERSTFDLAVVCGNLTVIIDGLDELTSLFQECFDVHAFLESLKHLHDQLGSSNVLLTTRNNVIAEDAGLEALAVERYELLGFDTESCRRYVTRRLSVYPTATVLVDKVMTRIAKIRIRDEEGRIIPFLADISTTVVEDELREGKTEDFEVSDDLTPYPSNNDLTDHIVHSMLRREQTRHSLEISETEVVELISDLVIDFGKRWPIAQMVERLQILYEARAQAIASKLELNPLLVKKGDDIELRYSFLSSYFEVLLMLRALMRTSLEAGPIRALSRLNPDSEEAQELKRFFKTNLIEVERAITAIVPKLRDQAIAEPSPKITKADIENAKRAIAGLLQLFFSIQSLPIQETTERLLSIFGLKGSDGAPRTLTGLQIKGAFPTLDFSNLIVTQSRFLGYRNLMASRFRNTKFMYSTFENCADLAYVNTELQPSMIDSTCSPGDLQEAFAVTQANKEGERAMIHAEIGRFLHSFFRGDRFTDNKPEFIKFSNKVQGLSADRFARLVAEGYFVHTKAKTSGDFYAVAQDFKPSVRKFLSDGYPDGRLKRFISTVR